jgi:DNA-binding SARP family transcriptional activator
VQIRVLGPLELLHGDSQLALGAPKQRIVLALLIARMNTLVPVDDLVDELWEERPPPSARANIRLYAANLRRLLSAAVAPTLRRLGSGYILSGDAANLDLSCFRDLVERGHDALGRDDYATAADRLNQALQLWRGPAIADITAGATLTRWRTAVDDERLGALEDRAAARLAMGAVDRAATDANEVLMDQPLRERAYALLIQARYQAGDIAGALAAYDTARRTLVEQLGLEPGDELRRLHRAVLNRAPGMSQRVGVAAPTTATVPVPRQLPPDIASFSGRTEHLRALDALLPADVRGPGPVVISAVSGTAGVGKTALAVHWACRAQDSFPDGQLYLNLRGFDHGGVPVDPAEGLHALLDALGVPPDRIPVDMQARVGLYRSTIAGRRLLILLDNARTADQIRPLLPGTPGCLVVVTSRNLLSGLVAVDGAHSVLLGVLSPKEARELLVARLGRDPVAAEPAAVEQIIARCAGLPLALAVVAGRAATHPALTLAALAVELCDSRDNLDAFAGDDNTTDLRAVFSWSYRTLDTGTARLFRLLGSHPGPDIGTPAAASLAGIPAARVRRLLGELADAHMVIEQAPDRYGLHDLLRGYAVERSSAEETVADRDAAQRRVLDHYLHTAHAAARILNPYRDPISLSMPAPGVAPEPITDVAHALAWFHTERPVLQAAVRHANIDGYTWPLTWTLTLYLDRQGYWHDQIVNHRAALAAARRQNNLAIQAHCHRALGRAYNRLGRLRDAYTHLDRARRLSAALNDPVGQADTHLGLAWLYSRQSRHLDALGHAQQALDLYQAAGHIAGQARALNTVGWHHAQLGQYQEALSQCRQALTLLDRLGDRHAEAHTQDSLGYAHHRLGHHREAATRYLAAADAFRALGNRYAEADTLTRLGDVLLASGEALAASHRWQNALTILDDLAHQDAEPLRRRLRAINGLDPMIYRPAADVLRD